MKTRENYLNGDCTHEQYYAQFVTDGIKNIVEQSISKDILKQAIQQDENLNSIPLNKWDSIGEWIRRTPTGLGNKMKQAGDYLTLSGLVCVAKEAARQIASE